MLYFVLSYLSINCVIFLFICCRVETNILHFLYKKMKTLINFAYTLQIHYEPDSKNEWGFHKMFPSFPWNKQYYFAIDRVFIFWEWR